MKAYVIHKGAEYQLLEERRGGFVVGPEVARSNIYFSNGEFVGVTVDNRFHFRVERKHYYANTNFVSVVH